MPKEKHFLLCNMYVCGLYIISLIKKNKSKKEMNVYNIIYIIIYVMYVS